MADPATLAALISSISNAINIAKGLRGVDAALAQAELKLRIAELIEALADAKMSAVEINDLLAEKESVIEQLNEALLIKVTVVRYLAAYYEKGPKGGALGEPYCLKCWEADHKLFHLVADPDSTRSANKCPVCSERYVQYETNYIVKEEPV